MKQKTVGQTMGELAILNRKAIMARFAEARESCWRSRPGAAQAVGAAAQAVCADRYYQFPYLEQIGPTTSYRDVVKWYEHRAHWRSIAVVLLAGQVAEQKFTGEPCETPDGKRAAALVGLNGGRLDDVTRETAEIVESSWRRIEHLASEIILAKELASGAGAAIAEALCA